jgi:hypothetical protein
MPRRLLAAPLPGDDFMKLHQISGLILSS